MYDDNSDVTVLSKCRKTFLVQGMGIFDTQEDINEVLFKYVNSIHVVVRKKINDNIELWKSVNDINRMLFKVEDECKSSNTEINGSVLTNEDLGWESLAERRTCRRVLLVHKIYNISPKIYAASCEKSTIWEKYSSSYR